jgi:hypothetical protein
VNCRNHKQPMRWFYSLLSISTILAALGLILLVLASSGVGCQNGYTSCPVPANGPACIGEVTVCWYAGAYAVLLVLGFGLAIFVAIAALIARLRKAGIPRLVT